jgi:hypothetical protein
VHDYSVHFNLFRVGCCMAARPKETTIERIYREVTRGCELTITIDVYIYKLLELEPSLASLGLTTRRYDRQGFVDVVRWLSSPAPSGKVRTASDQRSAQVRGVPTNKAAFAKVNALGGGPPGIVSWP